MNFTPKKIPERYIVAFNWIAPYFMDDEVEDEPLVFVLVPFKHDSYQLSV